MEAKDIIARRVAREIKPEMLVNLGIGLPSLVANYLPKDVHVFFQAENGVIGLGPRPPEGMEDPDLTDAGGGFVTAMPGAASIDSAMSFGAPVEIRLKPAASLATYFPPPQILLAEHSMNG